MNEDVLSDWEEEIVPMSLEQLESLVKTARREIKARERNAAFDEIKSKAQELTLAYDIEEQIRAVEELKAVLDKHWMF